MRSTAVLTGLLDWERQEFSVKGLLKCMRLLHEAEFARYNHEQKVEQNSAAGRWWVPLGSRVDRT